MFITQAVPRQLVVQAVEAMVQILLPLAMVVMAPQELLILVGVAAELLMPV